MRILVSGASGFVGRVLSGILRRSGHHVVAMVRDPALVPNGAEAFVQDLGSCDRLKLPRDIEAVVHLAQSRAYRSFPQDAGEMFRINVQGTEGLLEAAAEAKVERFCLISSGSVYEPYTAPLVEDAGLSPTSYLGASKLAAEIIARPFQAVFPLSTLRLFSPYGPGQTGRLVPDLIRRIGQGEPVTLPETGGGMTFSPTHVDDICCVILGALEQSWTATLNVASPEKLSIEEAAQVIGRVLGRPPVFERKRGGAPIVVPDLARLRACYDLTRFRSFSDGINSAIAGLS